MRMSVKNEPFAQYLKTAPHAELESVRKVLEKTLDCGNSSDTIKGMASCWLLAIQDREKSLSVNACA